MSAQKTKELKLILDEHRQIAHRKHMEGASGLEVCRALCQAVDEVITELFESGHGYFDGALVALGGYGRGLLNPHSDVDLLFLLKDPVRGQTHKPPDALLARLWDLGLKVGHSSRTVAVAISLGRTDLYSRASMMESRFLAGSRALYDSFHKKYYREVTRRKPRRFTREKTEEMERRWSVNGKTLRLVEPNVKESRGGLRDYHTAFWIIKAREEINTVEDLVARGIIPADSLEPVNEAHSCLLRLRNALHWQAGGPMDTLSHDLQPAIARQEGFTGSGNNAVAELMKRYYESAGIIDRFTSQVVAFALAYKRGLGWISFHTDNDGLFTDGRMLRAKAFPPEGARRAPTILFRIARRLDKEGLDPSPNLGNGLAQLAGSAPDEWFTGPSAGALFLSILRLPNSAKAVRVFHQCGMLARFIPEFEAITNLAQFDMFHRYTVDEHIIKALEKLEAIEADERVCPELRKIFRSQPDLEIIKLALLFHDLGKRAEDHHAVELDMRAPIILRRPGLNELVDPVNFLVRNHLLMSYTAQRLDFSTPETLRGFCAVVGNRENLKRLYLLTYADIAAVGPDVWNQWKDKLLLELYQSAEKYFVEGEAMFLPWEQQLSVLAGAVTQLGGRRRDAGGVRRFLELAPERYLQTVTPEEVAKHLSLVERSRQCPVAISFKPNPDGKTGEVTLASREHTGFFSVVAGALTAKNVSIIEARINTFEGNTALDTITVKGAELSVFSEPTFLARFEKELADLLKGKKDVAEMVGRRARYIQTKRETRTLEPRVLVLNNLSDTNTVVEIWAPDRLGLLYDITRAMARLGLDIFSAKISTEGRVAVNVFYITDGPDRKVEGEKREREITSALMDAITLPHDGR